MILLIDSYDSFTNNLSELLSQKTGKRVVIIHNDTFAPSEYEQFRREYLPAFEYIVIGPGPGHPAIEQDIGIIRWLLSQARDNADFEPVPILGVCLGFQSVCLEFGNPVVKLDTVKHGQIYEVTPVGESEIYRDTTPFNSVRYHSLHVPEVNDEIVPLAYTKEGDKSILMAMKHKSLPFFGVQYHPESICSEKGSDLVENFSAFAANYNKVHRTLKALPADFMGHTVRFPYLMEGLVEHPVHVSVKKVRLEVTPVDVCEFLDQRGQDFLLLNSACFPGEWSIIGLPIPGETEILTHSVDDMNTIYRSTHKGPQHAVSLGEGDTVWTVISNDMKNRYVSRKAIEKHVGNLHSRPLPFWGGYLGLISYEEGQHIVVKNLTSFTTGNTPDMKLAFIERFMVYDHTTGDYFVVSIRENDGDWVDSFDLSGVVNIDISTIPETVSALCVDKEIHYDFPSRETYGDQFRRCQEILQNGDSYELCLTTSSKVTLPKSIRAWDIYKVLTLRKNPSPFSGFMAFDDCTLISSSPERFLSWKDDNDSKLVELRPIKGTVRNGPSVTLADATRILKTPKEMGENLMIVDLIRHDLYQFTPNVEVTKLMGVEEYKTVYQLVSVIRGRLSSNESGSGHENGYSGIDILHQSLPPGSMTGAPKKRSVELLQSIENMQPNNVAGRRGIYSGLMGYWSVTDDADWSVIIRSVFRYENDLLDGDNTSVWRLGAGGAITVLSDEEGEWEEMELKLLSALEAIKG